MVSLFNCVPYAVVFCSAGKSHSPLFSTGGGHTSGKAAFWSLNQFSVDFLDKVKPVEMV